MKTGAICKPVLEFTNRLEMPIALQTRKGKPNLHIRAWRGGKLMTMPPYPLSDGEVVLKPGETVRVELDLGALGFTRQQGHYLVAVDVPTALVNEEGSKRPRIALKVATQLQFVVE